MSKKRSWTTLKRIIGKDRPQQIFLTLIDNEGNILSANNHMQKEFECKSTGHFRNNFFNIIYPPHTEKFREMIGAVAEEGMARSMELLLRNGNYHPMKWEINLLEKEQEEEKKFLCVGYKLIDEDRLKKINRLGKKYYELIFEDLNEGILFHDVNGDFITISQKAAEIFHVTLEELYRIRNIDNLWNTTWNITTEKGEPVPFKEAPFMKALRTGAAQKEILIVPLLNGDKKRIQFDAQPIFEPGKSMPFSVVSRIMDVSSKKQSASGYNETEMILRSFIEKTPNLAWIVDEEDRLLFANDLFFRFFHIDIHKAVGNKIVDLLPETTAYIFADKHRRVLNSGTPIDSEKKMMLADGTNIIFHIKIFLIGNGTGKKYVGGHAVNLADKYLVEKQLRDANDRLLNINRAVNNAIWEWDMREGKTFRNEKLLDMIGYSSEATQGISWWLRRIHPEDRNRVSDKIKETTELNNASWEDEYRFKCADGTYKHIHDRGFVVYENGLPVKMIGSLQDVTVLKELKDQLLEEKLQRQREISETIIRVQENERRRIGQELHDNVNQILTTVRLFVEMLTPQNRDEQDIKKKSIEYTLTAIEEIRKLSRELAVPELKEKSLVHAIQKMVTDINISNAVKIKFIYDAESGLLSPGKKVTLFRILQEQMKNILKYSKATEVTIYLDCKSDQAQLVIRDNGIGFDAKQTRTGVGLSSIYNRADFYNGTVHIDTASGKGCTLTVKIPII